MQASQEYEHMRSQMQPVIEVMAEIGFATADGSALPDQAGPQLFDKLKRRYPVYERATDVQLQVEMHDDIDAIEARCDRVSHRFLYRTDPPAVVVQLSSSALQLQFLGPYVGWDMIQDIIEREWTTTVQTLKLRLASYLSLRFVCHLPLLPARQSLAFWIKSNPYVPEAMRHTNRGYQCRMEVNEPSHDVTTTIGISPVDGPVMEALDIKPAGLDIGVRQELTHRVVRKPVAAVMQTLHGRVQYILEHTLSAAAKHHLQWQARGTVEKI